MIKNPSRNRGLELSRESRAKRILFITHSSSLYGAQKSLLDLIAGLDRHVYAPVVLSPDTGPLVEELLGRNVRVHIAPTAWWVSKKDGGQKYHRLKTNLMTCRQLKHGDLLEDIDLIYTNTAVIPLGGMLSWVTHIPHVWHIREFVEEDYGFTFDFPLPLCGQFIKRSSRKIIFNSKAVQKKYSRFLNVGQDVVIYNGPVEERGRPGLLRDLVNLKESGLRVCLVGSVSEAKGQEDAIAALKLLSQSLNCKATLHFIGTGPHDEMEKLRCIAENLGVLDNVVWEGYRSNIKDLYRTFDLCWICSRAEAFGRVAVEAMSEGTPVIAYATGGVPEIIEHGVNGFLVPNGDIERLVQATVKIINDSNLYSKIQQHGIDTVEKRFGMNRYVAEVSSLMGDIVGMN